MFGRDAPPRAGAPEAPLGGHTGGLRALGSVDYAPTDSEAAADRDLPPPFAAELARASEHLELLPEALGCIVRHVEQLHVRLQEVSGELARKLDRDGDHSLGGLMADISRLKEAVEQRAPAQDLRLCKARVQALDAELQRKAEATQAQQLEVTVRALGDAIARTTHSAKVDQLDSDLRDWRQQERLLGEQTQADLQRLKEEIAKKAETAALEDVSIQAQTSNSTIMEQLSAQCNCVEQLQAEAAALEPLHSQLHDHRSELASLGQKIERLTQQQSALANGLAQKFEPATVEAFQGQQAEIAALAQKSERLNQQQSVLGGSLAGKADVSDLEPLRAQRLELSALGQEVDLLRHNVSTLREGVNRKAEQREVDSIRRQLVAVSKETAVLEPLRHQRSDIVGLCQEVYQLKQAQTTLENTLHHKAEAASLEALHAKFSELAILGQKVKTLKNMQGALGESLAQVADGFDVALSGDSGKSLPWQAPQPASTSNSGSPGSPSSFPLSAQQLAAAEAQAKSLAELFQSRGKTNRTGPTIEPLGGSIVAGSAAGRRPQSAGTFRTGGTGGAPASLTPGTASPAAAGTFGGEGEGGGAADSLARAWGLSSPPRQRGALARPPVPGELLVTPPATQLVEEPVAASAAAWRHPSPGKGVFEEPFTNPGSLTAYGGHRPPGGDGRSSTDQATAGGGSKDQRRSTTPPNPRGTVDYGLAEQSEGALPNTRARGTVDYNLEDPQNRPSPTTLARAA